MDYKRLVFIVLNILFFYKAGQMDGRAIPMLVVGTAVTLVWALFAGCSLLSLAVSDGIGFLVYAVYRVATDRGPA